MVLNARKERHSGREKGKDGRNYVMGRPVDPGSRSEPLLRRQEGHWESRTEQGEPERKRPSDGDEGPKEQEPKRLTSPCHESIFEVFVCVHLPLSPKQRFCRGLSIFFQQQVTTDNKIERRKERERKVCGERNYPRISLTRVEKVKSIYRDTHVRDSEFYRHRKTLVSEWGCGCRTLLERITFLSSYFLF